MSAEARVQPSIPFFTHAHASAEHWGLAAKACLEGIAARAPACNFGILYATEAFGPDLPSILTFLRETTRIEAWIGAVAPGVIGGATEYRKGGALAVMAGALPPDSWRIFAGLDMAAFRDRMSAWVTSHGPCAALVHGDPRNPGMPALVEGTAGDAGALVGGLVSGMGPPSQVADNVVSGGLSGLMLGAGMPVLVGLTQGCSPLGPVHVVTEAVDGVLMGLDGRPAVEVLKEEAGALIARDLRRAAGYIHVALPIDNADRGDYVVRILLGIDPRQGWLAVGERLEAGRKLMFVRRDGNDARFQMASMLADLKRRLDRRKALAAHYVTCIGRGAAMFGEDGVEVGMIREALGDDVPLVGFFANGEICGSRLYGYTGVLTVFPEPRP